MSKMRSAAIWLGTLCLAASVLASEQSERLTARGMVEYHAKRYPEALQLFEQAVQADTKDSKAAYYRGLTLGRMGNFHGAVSDLLKIVNEQPDSDQARLDLGIALVQSGKYEEALPLLDQAVKLPGEEATASLFLGIAHLALQQREVAQAHFERAADGEPPLSLTARYYLGLISYEDRDWDAAEEHLGGVIAASPDSEVGHEAAILMQRVKANAQPVFQVYGDVGFQYDSNVVLAPSNNTVKTQSGISDQEDGRAVITLGGRYVPLRGRRVQLSLGYEFYQSLHFNLTDFNLQDHRPSAVITYTSERFRLGMLGRYDFYLLEADTFLQEVLAEPWVDILEGDWGSTQLFYRMRRRDYLKRPFSGLVDAFNHGTGVRQIVPLGNAGSYLSAGYTFDHEEPINGRGDAFEYDGHEVGVGAGWRLPWSVFADGSYAYRHEDYARASGGRNDDEHIASVAATRPFNEHISLRLAYLADLNGSNDRRYDYDRHIVSLTVAMRY